VSGLLEAAAELCAFMEARRWKFCIIGGLAVQQWGEPRTTLDVDFSLLTGWGEEAPYVSALLEQFPSRIPDAHAFALAHRVLLIRASNGCDVDIALSALPFEEAMVDRAVKVAFSPDLLLRCCTAEDLVVMKAFAGRPRDWQDVECVVSRREHLDQTYIIGQLEPLCVMREDRETLARLRDLFGVAP
jgi:hypothetical protein